MALAAASDLLPSSRQGMPGPSARDGKNSVPLRIKNIAIEQALILPEENITTVQLVLSPNKRGYGFRISSLGEESNWTSHVAGELIVEGEVLAPPEMVDLAELRALCSTDVPVADHYRTCQEHGLNYGSGFQAIKKLFRGEDIALGEIELPESLKSDSYRLHPALFDAALQVAMTSMPAPSNRDVYLPATIKELRVYRHVDVRIWSLAKVMDSDEKRFTADVFLFDESGVPIAAVEGLTVKRVSPEVLAHYFKTKSDYLYEIDWVVQATTISDDVAEKKSEAAGSWLIFADRTGMGRKLAERLEEAGNNCILAYANDFTERNHNVWHLDPAEPDDFQRLLTEAFQEETPPLAGIVHLWSLDAPDTAELTNEKLHDAQTLVCGSVLHFVQAYDFAMRNHIAPLRGARLWLVTRNAVSIDQHQDSPAIAQAPVWGLGKVIAMEHPELYCARIDLDRKAEDAGALFQEIRIGTEEDQVAFRDNIRYVARLVPYGQKNAQSRLDIPQGRPYRLGISRRGTLDNLELALITPRPPKADEVEIRVLASGLNFRDVLNALDLYPGEPGPLGGECAGEVVAVRAGVTEFQTGDPVIALAPGSLGQYVTTPAALAIRKPEILGFDEAATIPVVFLTAYYCLHHVAKISAGDRVLIHAGTGGVGQAAIQLAQLARAEVFATASPHKWGVLRSLGIQHIMNSRTLDFADRIMEFTEGQGVDIVLNSLTSENFIEKSLSVLNSGGSFLEIGKVGVWEPGQVAWFRPDVAYSLIDLAQISQEQPASIQAMLEELMPLFESGALKPLPRQVFPISRAIDAFRHMQQAKHTGKVVITPIDPTETDKAAVFQTDGTYLITGGLGGLGLKVAQWMVDQGARYLVLTGRRGPSEEVQAILQKLEETAAGVLVAGADVTDEARMTELLQEIDTQMPPLRGIIHAAGILDDGVLLQQDMVRFEKVMAPKVAGSWHLHILTQGYPLDFFVCFSSIVSLLGAPAQGSYAAANTFMDALAHHRHALGLPALSINWGAWAGIGMVADLDERDRDRLEAIEMGSIDPEQGVSILGSLMGRPEGIQVGVSPTNWSRFLRQFSRVPPFLSELIPGQSTTIESIDINHRLKQASEAEYEEVLTEFVSSKVAAVLDISPSRLDIQQSLHIMGLDSLMAIELRNLIRSELDMDIPMAKFVEDGSVFDLTREIKAQLIGGQVSTGEAAGVRKNNAELPIEEKTMEDEGPGVTQSSPAPSTTMVSHFQCLGQNDQETSVDPSGLGLFEFGSDTGTDLLLSSAKVSYLKDHIIEGHAVMSAAGFVVPALSRIMARRIDTVKFYRRLPLWLDSDEMVLHWGRNGRRCSWADAGGELMSLRVSDTPSDISPELESATAILARCFTPLDMERLYEMLEKHPGMNLRGAFRSLHDLYIGSAEAFGRVCVAYDIRDPADILTILLDGCFQTAGSLVPLDAHPRVLSHIESLALKPEEPVREAWCHARARSLDKHQIIADLTIRSVDHRLLGTIRGLQFQRVISTSPPMESDPTANSQSFVADMNAGREDNPTDSAEYCDLSNFHKLDNRSLKYCFDEERDICWDRLNETGLFFSDEYFRKWGVDIDLVNANPRARDLFDWWMALFTCDSIDAFEVALIYFLHTQQAEMGNTKSAMYLIEEEKHIRVFRRFGKHLLQLRPELANDVRELREGTKSAIRAFGSNKHPKMLMNALFIETMTIYIYRILNRSGEKIQPTWLSLHATHAREESQHLITDAAYLKAHRSSLETHAQNARDLFKQLDADWPHICGLDGAVKLMEKQFPSIKMFRKDIPSLYTLPFFDDVMKDACFRLFREMGHIFA